MGVFISSFNRDKDDLSNNVMLFASQKKWLETKKMIVDYSKRRGEHSTIHIDGAVVEQLESFKFLGVHITNKLSWSKHTRTVLKTA